MGKSWQVMMEKLDVKAMAQEPDGKARAQESDRKVMTEELDREVMACKAGVGAVERQEDDA